MRDLWTPAELALLASLARTMSAEDIGRAISKVSGIRRSRNAVIGAAQRAGVSLGDRGRRVAGAPQFDKKPEPALPRPRPVKLRPAAPKLVRRPFRPEPRRGPPFAVADLRIDSCRWIAGDPRVERPFACDEKARPGCPYCEKHAAKAWAPAPRKRAVV